MDFSNFIIYLCLLLLFISLSFHSLIWFFSFPFLFHLKYLGFFLYFIISIFFLIFHFLYHFVYSDLLYVDLFSSIPSLIDWLIDFFLSFFLSFVIQFYIVFLPCLPSLEFKFYLTGFFIHFFLSHCIYGLFYYIQWFIGSFTVILFY